MEDIDKEEKFIKGYEGLYSVTRRGDVYSYQSGHRYPLAKIFNTRRKRWCVRLCIAYDGIMHDIHSLVAKAFMYNPKGFTRVGFKDGNPNHYSLDNLYFIDELTYNIPHDCHWLDGWRGHYYFDRDMNVYNRNHQKLKMREEKYNVRYYLLYGKDKYYKVSYKKLKQQYDEAYK